MDRVRDEVARINGCSSHLTQITLDLDYWHLKETGPHAQKFINDELKEVDLVVFLFHGRCGEMTRKEFDAVLAQFLNTGHQEFKVWFEYMPEEFAKDPGPEYVNLLNFRKYLNTIPPHGVIYNTYKSDAPSAKPFSSNETFPSFESLCWQEFSPFMLRSKEMLSSVVADETKIPVHEPITREMIQDHWRERSKRTGLGPVLSNRYKKDEDLLYEASEKFVAFILKRTRQFLANKKVIELGSGIGRFTHPLLDLAQSLTIVDMSPA